MKKPKIKYKSAWHVQASYRPSGITILHQFMTSERAAKRFNQLLVQDINCISHELVVRPLGVVKYNF